MLSLFFLIVAVFLGRSLIEVFTPQAIRGIDSSQRNPLSLDWKVVWPAAFFVGILFHTVLVYGMACAFTGQKSPLLYGNLIATVISLTFIGLAVKKKSWAKIRDFGVPRLGFDFYFFLVCVFIAFFFDFLTFFKRGQWIHVGPSVFSDFGPHMAVIRSFSEGVNFPTTYPHFAAEGIRYHFFFLFLVGNLEWLGLPIDFSFNIASALSLSGFLLLLYALGFRLLGSRKAAALICSFFFFRSSFAFWTYLSDFDSNWSWARVVQILKNQFFIGKTLHEDWGFWNQNVFLNQRHLPFGLGIMLLPLVVYLSLLHFPRREEGESRLEYFKKYILAKTQWKPESYGRAIFLGLTLGLCGFWNGATVISSLLVLAVIAVFSRSRVEHLIVCVLSVSLVLLQTKLLMGPGGAGAMQFRPWFFVSEHTLEGVLSYYVPLMGVLPFLFFVGLFFTRKSALVLSVAGVVPFAFANIIQVTADIGANHKFIIIATIYLGIPVAALVRFLWNTRFKAITRTVCIVIVFLMTCTGLFDLLTIWNRNQWAHSYQLDDQDPLKLWVKEFSEPKDVFLTHYSVISPVFLAGRGVYFGWPYFAWSAGYDTHGRDRLWRAMYSASDPEWLRMMALREKIRFIVVDNENRTSREFRLNEETIKAAFTLVYNDPVKNVQVYEVK